MAVDKLVDSTQLDTDLTAVANAIRTKGGTSASLAFPSGFVDAIDAIETGGGGDPFSTYVNLQLSGDGIIETSGIVVGISLSRQNNITSLSLPNATSLQALPAGAFNNMTGIESFSAPKVTKVTANLLQADTALTSVNLTALQDTNLSLVQGCTSLAVISLPSVQAIYMNSFYGCTNLASLDVLATTGFTQGNNMNGCAKLKTLIIRKSGVASLSNINNFTNTPFASGGTGGTLYVPSAQISSYQSATNWSTILGYANNQILPIEGSIYETQYADGTPIT